MAKSLKRARELLSREDLIGFDTSEWAAAAGARKESGAAIRSSAAKVGGKAGPKIGAKIGTKAGVKAGPARS
jgi:hypothetical protein